jgi:predicted S18 family serine protease
MSLNRSLLETILIYQFQINKKLKVMSLSQNQAAADLIALKAQQEKIYAEFSVKLQALSDAITANGNVSPEVEAALAELKASVQATDDLVPDA